MNAKLSNIESTNLSSKYEKKVLLNLNDKLTVSYVGKCTARILTCPIFLIKLLLSIFCAMVVIIIIM